MSLTPDQREIVEQVVEQTLLKLGIDVSSPERINEFQENQRAIGEWRASVQLVQRAGLMAAVGTIVTGMIAALMIGITNMIQRGG